MKGIGRVVLVEKAFRVLQGWAQIIRPTYVVAVRVSSVLQNVGQLTDLALVNKTVQTFKVS